MDTGSLSLSMKHGSVKNVVWVFSDRSGMRQEALQQHGLRTIHFHHDLHFRGAQMLETMRPALLWMRLADGRQ